MPVLAYGAVGLVALSPASLFHVLFVHSESLYMLLSISALALCARAVDRPSPAAWWWSAALVGAAVLTRSIGVALIGAFVVHLLLRRPRHAPWLLLVAIGPLIVWKLAGPGGHPGYLSNFGQFYAQDWWSALVVQVRREVVVLWYGWVANWQEFGGEDRTGVSLLLAIGLAGSVNRALNRHADGVYVLLYLGIVIAWPYPAEARRFEWPIMALLLGHAIMALGAAGRRVDKPRVIALAHWVLLVVVAISIAPSVVFTATRLAHVPPDELAPYGRSAQWLRHPAPAALYHTPSFKALLEAAADLGSLVPRGECIIATKPSIVGWHADRITKGPPRDDSTDEEFWRGLRERGCRYVYTMGFATPTYPRPHYPYRRVEGRAEVLRVWTLVRGDDKAVSSVLLRLGESTL